MKRFLTGVLALVMILALTACEEAAEIVVSIEAEKPEM